MTPIARNHDDLGQGLTPDPEPRFAQVLVNKWAADNAAAGELEHAIDGTRFRHSDAGKCSRLLAYKAAGIPASDPMDLSGVWNTTLGSRMHEWWQEALAEQFPDCQIEVCAATVGADGSCHIDAVVRLLCPDDEPMNGRPVRTIAIELKSSGGYAFKAATGTMRKGTPAEGPKVEHILQASMNALAVDADEAVIVYLAKEALSHAVAKKFRRDELGRFLAEWTFTREQYEPLATLEAQRVSGILALVDEGTLARRNVPHEMPVSAEITDPSSGAWVERLVDGDGKPMVGQVGSYWSCAGYCSHQTVCMTTEPGRIPIESVTPVEVGA